MLSYTYALLPIRIILLPLTMPSWRGIESRDRPCVVCDIINDSNDCSLPAIPKQIQEISMLVQA